MADSPLLKWTTLGVAAAAVAVWRKARDEFWMLHWGPLEVIEESDLKQPVIKAMKEFGEALEPIGPEPPSLPVINLRSPSLHIAFACRDLIRSKWRIGLFGWFDE